MVKPKTAAERRAAAAQQRRGTEGTGTEIPGAQEIEARELLVGQKLFFPNSRKAQEIESILDDEGSDPPVRKVTAGDTQWSLPLDATVRVMS